MSVLDLEKRDRKLLLIAISAFLSMIFLDQTGVGVTLPRMQLDLGLSNIDVQWVMNAFFLMLSLLLLFSGRLSDYWGPRRLFIIGMSLFLVASVLCAIAPNSGWIIGSRALQGMGGSMALATYIILLSRRFPLKQRGKALGISAAFGSLFLSNGPLIGGLVSQLLSWRWIFWINLPIAAICIYFTLLSVPEDVPKEKHESFDVTGLLLFIISLGSIIVALMEGPEWDWFSSPVIILFLVSFVGFILFSFVELKTRMPLIQLHLFSNKIFLAGNVILFCTQACAIAMVFWVLWLQYSKGLTPLIAGLILLPAGIPYIITSRLGGGWLDRKGPKLPLCTGASLLLLGNIGIVIAVISNSYIWLFLSMVIYGCGWGLIIPCGILTVMGSVTHEQHGTASGVLNTMRQAGGALGLAVVGAVITSYEHSKISHFLATTIQEPHITFQQVNSLLAGSKQSVTFLSPAKITTLKEAAKIIYSHGFAYGMVASSLFALIGFIFAVMCLRNAKIDIGDDIVAVE